MTLVTVTVDEWEKLDFSHGHTERFDCDVQVQQRDLSNVLRLPC